jgi:hypothetical protein
VLLAQTLADILRRPWNRTSQDASHQEDWSDAVNLHKAGEQIVRPLPYMISISI